MNKVSMLAGAFVVAISASSASFAIAPPPPECPPGTTGTFPNCTPIQTGGTAVPEPGTLALLGLGVAGAILVGRRKNKGKKDDE